MYRTNVLNNNLSKDDISIDLISYLPAIKPLYHELSLKFVYIETGHILLLLAQQLSNYGISSQVEFIGQKIDDDNLLIARLIIGKSVSKLDASGLAMYYLKHDEEDIYRDLLGNKLIDIKSQDIFIQTHNYIGKLLNEAGALLSIEGEETIHNLVYSGMLLQYIAHCQLSCDNFL